MMIPCISEQSLRLFSVTADERFMLGPDIFNRTHSPIKMRRFLGNQEIDSWTEADFFESLSQRESRQLVGNRTYVLYGAAGSGKSETIRWLQYKMLDTPRAPFVVRVSRTELDPVKILEKMLQQFSGSGLTQAVLVHWESLQKKPVTLANHLVWSALGKMFDNDERIIPLSYKLRPIIEQNLKTRFAADEHARDSVPPELISLEQLEEIIEDSCFDCNINCDQLQSLMIRELEQEMFGGYNFTDTVKRIGNEAFNKSGIRPLLLIDDLVQSLNIFASDLLDFFITLDEGNWDIVIGLTPASFEGTKKGQELLNRITNLDTFDDRLMKLWFSDEHGSQSYFLDIENCIDYAARYLREAKRLNGYECGVRCIHSKYCSTIMGDSSEDLTLLPLNGSALKRMFANIPENKGRPRHYITSMGNVLALYQKNEPVTAWENYFKREYVPACPDSRLRLLVSIYSPMKQHTDKVVHLNPALAQFFYPDFSMEELPTSFELTHLAASQSTNTVKDLTDSLDPTKIAIRDWLDGQRVNKELLSDIRAGIVSVYRDVVQPNSLGLQYSPRQNSTTRLEKDYEGCKLALVFENVEAEKIDTAIIVNRVLGHTAFLFESLNSLRGLSKEKQLLRIFSQDVPFDLMFQSDKLRENTELKFTNEIGMCPSDFAYCCFSILLETGQANQDLPPFLKSIPFHNIPDELGSAPALSIEMVNLIYQNFKDWFLLRENIYDGPSIERTKKSFANTSSFIILRNVDLKNIDPHFKIGNYRLVNFIEKLQDYLEQLLTFWESCPVRDFLKVFRQVVCLTDEFSNPNLLEETGVYINSIAKYCALPIPTLPDWQTCYKLRNQLHKNWFRLHENSKSCPLFPALLTPISIQYHLVLYCTLHLPDWTVFFNLIAFSDEVIADLKSKHARIEKTIFDKQLSIFFEKISPLPEKNWQDSNTLPFLKELYSYVNHQRSVQNHLDYLDKVKLYSAAELIDNAQQVLAVIEQHQEFLRPEKIRIGIKKLRQNCEHYLQLIATLYSPTNNIKSTEPTVLEWQFYANQLSTATVIDSLQQLVLLIQKHKRINCSLRSVFLSSNDTDLTANYLIQTRFTSTNAACKSLSSQLDALKDVPDAGESFEKFNTSVPQVLKDVVLSLLDGEEPTLSLEQLSPKILESFQTFPGFKEVVGIRFIPKEQAK